ncbi:glutathione S-transferase family protein [Rhizobium leguminosarum]|uniref:glutathione S-transferase family protein n=2 Tax=Rhizobium/Agrobacterium group TaxID=227290 RepID=UPI0010304E37|nr:glutathione S-transferase family protein [Rhizobium leguminosarum]TAU84265.1 glutathione S-transferase family protein [Rhizobium leguminosarum]TAX10393.1 glutathione S-transferase family protein [Rhizobium leguminosarum]TAY13159.1 glutathione S-transferase family protein [Rhizobium leguminosarum]TAY17615.1 glutathione S-transferase family protein [Rhizobium leguminosarum]TAZ15060.1 glutathione S-transferase family protein [Rhizobium leguminosarum]
MGDLTLTTFDWVPEPPRGYVRDLRVRWALEESGLPYRVESVPFRDRKPEHFAHQPFGQVPWLTDGDISIFESGAILLHLGNRSDALMPADLRGRAEVLEWLFAALNSVEAASLPWSILIFSGITGDAPAYGLMDSFLKDHRLKHMEPILAGREWLAGTFSIADILMADVLRLIDRFDGLAGYPACRDYVARATARPSFAKAHADQIAHFAAADCKTGA